MFSMAGTSRRYPQELKDRAVQMVLDSRAEAGTEWAAMRRVAELLGIGSAETVRKWVRQAEVNRGQRAGQTTQESEVVRKLRRENAELKRANFILRAASTFFAAELDRPHQ
jgi:transposase